jgi:hypothetical protein
LRNSRQPGRRRHGEVYRARDARLSRDVALKVADGRIIGVVNRREIIRTARTERRVVSNLTEELKQRVPVR